MFHRIGLHDDLTVEAATDLSVDCSDPSLAGPDNLVLKAADSLRRRHGLRRGAAMRLVKRIPRGAGLGGGSADAAAALLLLTRLWEIPPGEEEMREIALGIGSDVPYFLRSGSARATSRGEKLEYFPLSIPYAILVAVPPIEVSTRWAYDAAKPGGHDGSDDLRTLILQHLHPPGLLRNVLVNDFERPVVAAHPEIGDLKRRLYDSGAEFCQMTGSGGGVFGLYLDADAAREAAGSLDSGTFVSVTPPGFTPDPGIGNGPRGE